MFYLDRGTYGVYHGPMPLDTLDDIKDAGVELIWNLVAEHSIVSIEKKFGFSVLYSPIRDYSIPDNIVSFLNDARFISGIVDTTKIYVHCLAGHGRTGMALAVLLMLKEGLSANDAIAITKKACKGPEAEVQILFVNRLNLALT